MKIKILLSIFVLSLITITAQAQYGKIRGVITDSETGETIIGASVLIEGTTKGAATNIDGEYIILAVSPGTVSLRISYIGYNTTVIEDVRINIDLTTEINVQLTPETVEGQEVVVVAQRELVRKDVTASLSSVGAEEIEAIPVENFSEVVELQAGVVDGHFRGGRTGEVGYWVDGVPVTDSFDGSLSAGVENASVQEVQVVTGAFSAEYGQAMSGIVNIVTKDGGDEFSGSVHTFAGDYVSNRDNLFYNINDINPISVRNLEASLGGPIIKEKLSFFGSVRYFSNDGWFYGQRIFNPEDVGLNSLNQIALLDTSGTGSGEVFEMNPYEKINGQLKLTWNVAKGLKIAMNGIYGIDEGKSGYDHSNKFLPTFARDQFTSNRSLYLKVTHLLSNSTFYDLSISNNYKKFESYVFEDPFDSRYLPNDYAGFRAPNVTSGFRVGGTDNGRYERETDTYIAKFDLTSQVDNQNQVKFGVEYRKHNLKQVDLTSIVVSETSGVIGLFDNGSYDVEPIEFSAYLQDKIEIGSLIINAGVRFDYFDAKFRVFTDPTDPNVVFPERQPDDLSLVYKDSDATYKFSPRLGIAFPVSEGGVVHFSYGHFFQIPNFSILYQNPYFRLNSGGSGLIGLLGNANLEPQKTVNGELGYKQELSSSSAIEITTFFRDIRNLAGTATDAIQIEGTSARYGIITNSDFGFIKGVVLAFDQSFGRSIFLTADYTFQVAKGNSSDPSQAYNAAAANGQVEKIIIPLDWDQLHTLNVTGSYRTDNGWGAAAIFTTGSGFPYTRDYASVITGVVPPSEIDLNSQRRPSIYNLDISVTKDIELSGKQSIQLYARADNVLDRGNERGIFGETGRATYSLYQTQLDTRTFFGDPFFLNQNYTRPDFYNEPRRVVFGFRYRF
ncbi:MAG: TonB-dependent receptor [Balneola sp.]